MNIDHNAVIQIYLMLNLFFLINAVCWFPERCLSTFAFIYINCTIDVCCTPWERINTIYN